MDIGLSAGTSGCGSPRGSCHANGVSARRAAGRRARRPRRTRSASAGDAPPDRVIGCESTSEVRGSAPIAAVSLARFRRAPSIQLSRPATAPRRRPPALSCLSAIQAFIAVHQRVGLLAVGRKQLEVRLLRVVDAVEPGRPRRDTRSRRGSPARAAAPCRTSRAPSRSRRSCVREAHAVVGLVHLGDCSRPRS